MSDRNILINETRRVPLAHAGLWRQAGVRQQRAAVVGPSFAGIERGSASASASPFGEGSLERGDFHFEQRAYVVRRGEVAVSSHPLELPGEVGGTWGSEDAHGSLQGVGGADEVGSGIGDDRFADLSQEFRGLDGEELYELPEGRWVATDEAEGGLDVEPISRVHVARVHVARVPLDR